MSAILTRAQIVEQASGLLSGERDWIANMSNIASHLFWEWNKLKAAEKSGEASPLNWLGFYLNRFPNKQELVLGPFHGQPACIRIPFARGVCGKCAREQKSVIVPDVHEFPGHIACDSASNSEIVVPVCKNGALIAVLDVDSRLKDCFTADDQAFLEKIAGMLSDACDFDFATPNGGNTSLDGVVIEECRDATALHDVLSGAFPTEDEAHLVAALLAAGSEAVPVTLAARLDGRVVGQVLLSACQLRSDNAESGNSPIDALALAPVAVDSAVRGRGLARRLIEAAHAAAPPDTPIVVLGHATMYPKFGYRQCALRLALGEEQPPPECVMLRAPTEALFEKINAGGYACHYHSAFGGQ